MFKMSMNLTRPRAFMPPAPQVKSMAKGAAPKSRTSSLLEPMVSRVHGAKAGCSSCAKKKM